jgi:hypothetical protein
MRPSSILRKQLFATTLASLLYQRTDCIPNRLNDYEDDVAPLFDEPEDDSNKDDRCSCDCRDHPHDIIVFHFNFSLKSRRAMR